MFSPDEIKKSIQDHLNQDILIPPGHKAALVTYINKDKAEIAVAVKINEHWSANLVATHNWVGGNDIGAISKVTW